MKVKFNIVAAITPGLTLGLTLGLGLLAGNIEAGSETGHARVSIAISGGASKGAYEAGLNWSAIKMVREGPGLVTLTGGQFFPIEMASITGASAGGINTLLSGLSWCSRDEKDGGLSNRIDDNLFRDIWLRVDINTLLPRDADSPIYLPDDAVLSRKDFLDAATELRKKWSKPLFRKDCRVPLGVTVTKIEPEVLSVGEVEVQNQRFYIPFELRVIDDSSIKFFFEPADYPKVADPSMILMPRAHDTLPFSIDNQQIIDTAFTTSAFPMAFGRKRLQYCRLVQQESAQELASTKVDTSLLCPDGYELAEAEFADGGLFDNLPIGVARTLAESNKRNDNAPYPVTYFYIDPNRIRYEIPTPKIDLACESVNPSEACRQMEFSAASESELLVGFLGTARRYELYRELTSDAWQLNLSKISYKLSKILKQREITLDCQQELPYFELSLDCTEALLRAGQLLEIAYDRINPVIDKPYSVKRLRKAGIITDCKNLGGKTDSKTACTFNIPRYRKQLSDAMLSLLEQENLTQEKLYSSIRKSRLSVQNDRTFRVSGRSAPITGTLLEDFGSFLDYKFREYDYYVGVYDGMVMVANNLCSLQYYSRYQSNAYKQCFDSTAKQLHTILGLNSDSRGRYVFAWLAMRKYGKEKLLQFAYQPMPPADSDMRIIHDGLGQALAVGESETAFFKYLKAEGFVPTPADKQDRSRLAQLVKSDEKPLMEQIIDDPDSWATELTRRLTNRLVYLETQAEDIYAAREPDINKRESANAATLGAAAFVLQSSTYRYPDYSFAPSTAPANWFWRNVIPYELGFDFAEGDLLLTWQPTMALSQKDLLGARLSLGFAGGLLHSSANDTNQNFLAIGIDYTRQTSFPNITSFGFTPTWYHAYNQPENRDRDTLGGDIHVGILKNRLRIGLGTRDFDHASDAWFITVGITDMPGLIYWLSR
ncbi:MAG: patatin-like phospholipase family protein [Gammaproteobacteria bacterium]|nr:patatin-like phospholipase family protein [Gammaproteobacteria bacterium]